MGITDKTLEDIDIDFTERQKKYGTSLAFSITNSCPLKCEHCVVDANSIEDELSDENFEKCLLDLKEYKGIERISVTGGEPFYIPSRLKIFSEFCKELNIELGVVTSAYWASDNQKAIEIVKQFPEISSYSISTDRYHIKYVPLTNIKNAYLAAKSLGKTINIRISGETEESVRGHEILKEVYKIVKDPKEVSFQRILPLGRAEKNCKENLKFTDRYSPMPCSTVSPLITESGIVDPCCGGLVSLRGKHPLVLGNVKEAKLSTILKRIESKWLLNYIRLWGFTELIMEIENSEFKNELPNQYLENDICSTCNHLFANEVISSFLNKMSSSLAFKLKVAYGMKYYYDDDKPLQIISESYNLQR